MMQNNRSIRTVGVAGIIGILLITMLVAPALAADAKSITVSGSTTVLPIASKAAEAYMAAHPDADIKVSGGGSGAGIQAITGKTVDIGMSSRELKDTEKAGSLKVIPVAKDGIAIIVNSENGVESLTLDQLKKIYSGDIKGWQDVGGKTGEIEIVGRDSASGTREFFKSAVLGSSDFTKFMLEKNSNGAVQQYVSQTPGSIGYVGMGFEEGVKVVPIKMDDGSFQKATTTSVKSKAYPLSRDLYMITNGEASGLAKDFINFIISPEGQKIVEKEGFVSLT